MHRGQSWNPSGLDLTGVPAKRKTRSTLTH